MPPDDFESFLKQRGGISGPARTAMAAIAAQKSFRRALRAEARDRIVDASTEMSSAVSGWSVREIPVAVVECALAAILFRTNDVAESDRLREKSVGAVQTWALELDETIAKSRRNTDDDLMWLARSMAQRGLASYVLGDYRGAEALYREAIASLTSIWGADHLEVGTLDDDYATLLLRVGRTAEAETRIARAREIVTLKGFPYDTE